MRKRGVLVSAGVTSAPCAATERMRHVTNTQNVEGRMRSSENKISHRWRGRAFALLSTIISQLSSLNFLITASQLAKTFGVACIAWLAILRASLKFGKAWIYNYPRQSILQPSDLAGWKCLGMIQRSDRNFDNIIVQRILQNQWRATTARKAPDPIRDAYPSKLTTYKTNILTFDG